MSNLTNIANESSPPELQTDTSKTPPYLAMSEHSSVRGSPQHIRDWLMSSAQDSPASRSAWPESKRAAMMSETCGPQLSNALASYDRDTCSWRMSQGWLLADISAPSWETWPKAGLIVDGGFYQQPSAERRISVTGSGLLPTPTVNDSKNNGSPSQMSRNTLALNCYVKRWPTPQARDGDQRGAQAKRYHNPDRSNDLPDAVAAAGNNGSLNPAWVEWLMGWPVGWASLEPLPVLRLAPWTDEPVDVPRVATKTPNRTQRLKALGNGQVPAVAAAAWRLLTE